MKFRFYITDLTQGSVLGTDSLEDANNYSLSEDHFVVDTGTGEWLPSDGSRLEVEKAGTPSSDDDIEAEDGDETDDFDNEDK